MRAIPELTLAPDGTTVDPLDSLPGATFGASRDLEDFIYLISHDVRNSARALSELPQWIEEDLIAEGVKISPQVADNFALMTVHTRRLDRMLFDLLVYSRIGRQQQVRQIDLRRAVSMVMEEMVLPRNCQFESNIEQDSMTIGERDILTILIALISNAHKHNEAEEKKVILTIRRIGQEVVIAVADNGPGILPANREQVMETMATLKPRDEVEGSGMGLAHVRKVLKLYGGRMVWQDKTEDTNFELQLFFPL